MSNYVQISFERFVILIVVVFGMVLMWQLLVGNHRANIRAQTAREKYLIDNCKRVEEPKYSWDDGLKCND
jgi:hypothetical protein